MLQWFYIKNINDCDVTLNERISAYVEPYGQISGFEDSEANINMGMTYLIKDNLQLDYSYGTGLNNISNFMSIGCSINIL